MYLSPTCVSPSILPKQHFHLIQQNLLNTGSVPGIMVAHAITTPNPKHSLARQAWPHVTDEDLRERERMTLAILSRMEVVRRKVRT